MSDELVEYTGNSAPFHVGVGLMLFHRGLSFIVKQVYNDDADSRGLKINDEVALKQKLLRVIQRKYNTRIHHYKLKYRDISNNHIDKMNIIRYRFLKAFEGEDPSGEYTLFPNAFVCQVCGHYIMNQNLYQFNPRKCKVCKDGRYEQISLMRFCEDCGKIDKFFYKCKQHGTDSIILDRGDKDNIFTWNFKCRECKTELDVFKFECNHNISSTTEPIRDGKRKFKPITIRESGIFSPIVESNIDLPKTKPISDHTIEKDLVMLAFYFDKFRDKKALNNIFDVYKTLNAHQILTELGSEIPEQITEDYGFIHNVLKDMLQRKQRIPYEQLCEFNELSILKGAAGTSKQPSEFTDYIKEHEKEQVLIDEKTSHYKRILDEFGIEKINYLADVKVINSLIGLVKGINNFWDRDENNELKSPPHFEIFWKNLANEIIYNKPVDRDKDSFSVYSYPFETEGILVEFRPEKICEWLFLNDLINERVPQGTEREFLLELSQESNSQAYYWVHTLLHTFSHLFLKKMHLHTGLGINSCGEKIFVNGAAVFIYSNNNLNIGALQYLFENSIFCIGGIFENFKQEVTECSFDPLCMDEKGGCFSCLYIPEFVCCNFNLGLDRTVFTNKPKRSITHSYWGV